ncbi:MarR family transcriptional regulator [Tenacibaculum sp. HL-MS23]|uniref:GbsR/MarR family transcriptional regulator n=1 Tax=Tenacibaculum TaxID=104267 RepID=UPI001C4E69CC|nr:MULTISPECIES: MarR family transcriptional regulator [Tenacibaculum]QXP73809.1 MarR family transcriptional regulator [Tenacibaculum sp. AHE14PA]QXP75824.1 MarR family transcriptional regulator [Tenacibaculum sp. AHE15PA]WNW02384.1 MarR family transcriptional regulator [Tenacibaculum sp. HL-MS23]
MKNKLTEKQKELIESFGVVQEGMGLSPASARVDALLIVADTHELTFDEVRENLELSKSATSNAINNLLMLKRIGYKTKPGDRKRYFHTKLGQWKNSFKDSINALTSYNDVVLQILSNRTSKTPEFNSQLKDFTQFIEYYQKESIKLIENWKNE